MWSLKQTLATLAAYPPNSYNHLPDGYSPSKGIRMLFPPTRPPISILALGNYVLTYTGSVQTTQGDTAQMLVVADGAGRWGIWGAPSLNPLAISWAGGFVFKYSDDGNGHGYIINNSKINTGIVNGFNEPWIKQNWPQAFPASINLWMWVQDSTFIWAGTKASPGPVNEMVQETTT